jgi:hypothetical protein
MPLNLFESAYIRTRSAIGEADWWCMTELQRADLICCEMHRLAKIGPDDEAEAAPSHGRVAVPHKTPDMSGPEQRSTAPPV